MCSKRHGNTKPNGQCTHAPTARRRHSRHGVVNNTAHWQFTAGHAAGMRQPRSQHTHDRLDHNPPRWRRHGTAAYPRRHLCGRRYSNCGSALRANGLNTVAALPDYRTCLGVACTTTQSACGTIMLHAHRPAWCSHCRRYPAKQEEATTTPPPSAAPCQRLATYQSAAATTGPSPTQHPWLPGMDWWRTRARRR